MINEKIDGLKLKNMLLGGIVALKNNADTVNDLNVFPVPDGDTGYNMLKTLEGGVNELAKQQVETVFEVMNAFSKGALLGARGNSGVILSQIVKGWQLGFENQTEVTLENLKNAFEKGVETSYKAVEKPVEGTILTVYREATEYAVSKITNDTSVEEFLKNHYEQALKTLAKTKEILPVLAEADVIDSGGAGYTYFIEGVLRALTGEEVSLTVDDFGTSKQEEINLDLFTRDSEMVYGYCTEFILRLQTKKVNVEEFDIAVITDYLKSIGGNSIVAYKMGDVVKVHVHTLTPGLILTKCQEYGEFLTLKIENMTLQHNEVTEKKVEKKHKKVAVVAVVSGSGMKQIFEELGADAVIDGGQTSNPSSGDFVKAFESLNADNIIVLPNNSNVFLSAKQAEDIYKDAKIYVVHTKTMQQGYVAMSVFNENEDVEMQLNDINGAISGVDSIEVTYAIRNATVNGVTVQKDEFMAICDGELSATGKNAVEAVVNALKNHEDIENKELLTLFTGEDATKKEIDELLDILEEEFPDLECVTYEGGQKVYKFLISLE